MLFPRVGFIITNPHYPAKCIARFWNRRGTAEQWLKESKYVTSWTQLSRHEFVANQVGLRMFVLAYTLVNFVRMLVLLEDMKHRTLISLQTRLINAGGLLVRLAKGLVTSKMTTAILQRVGRLRPTPGSLFESIGVYGNDGPSRAKR